MAAVGTDLRGARASGARRRWSRNVATPAVIHLVASQLRQRALTSTSRHHETFKLGYRVVTGGYGYGAGVSSDSYWAERTEKVVVTSPTKKVTSLIGVICSMPETFSPSTTSSLASNDFEIVP